MDRSHGIELRPVKWDTHTHTLQEQAASQSVIILAQFCDSESHCFGVSIHILAYFLIYNLHCQHSIDKPSRPCVLLYKNQISSVIYLYCHGSNYSLRIYAMHYSEVSQILCTCSTWVATLPLYQGACCCYAQYGIHVRLMQLTDSM